MPREVIEYRAVGVDNGENGEVYRDEGAWTIQRESAELELAELRRLSSKIPFDDVFLERRVTTYGEPERVKEGAGNE